MNSEYTLIYVKRNGQRNEENGSLRNEARWRWKKGERDQICHHHGVGASGLILTTRYENILKNNRFHAQFLVSV